MVVTFITRPYFLDISLELIAELKKRVSLNLVIVVSSYSCDHLGIKIDEEIKSGKAFVPESKFSGEVYNNLKPYINGVNVLCKYEEDRETSFKNILTWKRFLKENPVIGKSNLVILETLVLSDLYLLYKMRHKRLFHVLHDPVLHAGEKSPRQRLIRKYYFPYINSFVLYSSNSAKMFATYSKKFSEKTLTLQMPVYKSLKLENSRQSNISKREKVVFFGRISPYKGVETFFAAATILALEFPNVDFIIAGKSIPGYCPDFLSRSNHKNIIIINEFIAVDRLSEIMSDATLSVLPYKEATQSGVIMTCYAFNVPVLVSDCPGLLEYCFDPENFSFEKDNVDELITKTRNLLMNMHLVDDYKEKISRYDSMNVSKMNVEALLSLT